MDLEGCKGWVRLDKGEGAKGLGPKEQSGCFELVAKRKGVSTDPRSGHGMGLLFTINRCRKCQWRVLKFIMGAQPGLRWCGNKVAPPAVWWHWWYLTSSLYLESPLTLYPPFHTLPLVSPGLEFLKEGGGLQLSPDRSEAVSPRRRR